MQTPAVQGMGQPQFTIGRQIGEKALRSGVGVVGLLIIRAVASALPMLKNAGPIWQASTQDLQAEAQKMWGAAIQAALTQGNTGAVEELQRKATAAWQQAAQFATITPLTVVNAVIDTVVFIILLRFSFQINATLRNRYTKFPALGQMLNMVFVTVVVALAYNSYQGIAYPLLGLDYGQLYGWIFLFLALAPLVAIAVLVSKNMDAISGLVFHSGQVASGTLRCAACGAQLESGAKFCPACGAASPGPLAPAPAAKTWCPSCGVENKAGAKFCKGCGGAL
jgi:hypothetical protein